MYLHVQTIERDALRDYIVALEDKEVSLAFGSLNGRPRTGRGNPISPLPGDPALKIEVHREAPADAAGAVRRRIRAPAALRPSIKRNPNDHRSRSKCR
jgi:hypothetical protein